MGSPAQNAVQILFGWLLSVYIEREVHILCDSFIYLYRQL
jgi:hypothetical protein